MKESETIKDELSEDYCFVCKDGGDLRVCDFKKCLKAYHPYCVGKDTSFMEGNEFWTCGWHSCFICQKASTFQCYCCPKSICNSPGCRKQADFVQVKKMTRGFCCHCLKLATLIESKTNVDSDGEKVDFEDTDTYEFLFKDYWEIVKDQEELTLIDLQGANALLKRSVHNKGESDSDKPIQMDPESKVDEFEDKFDFEFSLLDDSKGKNGKVKKPKKRYWSKKKEFIGWGSVELISFLTSIGKNTKETITQLDACEIIKDYIRQNNLHNADNKKKNNVICDERLGALFRKKKVKFHKIYSLLESHFAANVDSDDSFCYSSQEVDDPFGRRKRRLTSNDSEFNNSHPNIPKENTSSPAKHHYASIIGTNINSAYLKRSLVAKLTKNPDTFEAKVTGCFVRVKFDPKDFYFMPGKMYKLGQVTGVKKVLQTYKIDDMSTDMVLRVSNIFKDVQIFMLSDNDFEEEECEDLRLLANKGLFNRPTVGELEEKIRFVHADIMNHWIDQEILKLQKLIDRANEKGWRRELMAITLFEYVDKREKLLISEERERLLHQIPSVIADTCQIEENTEGNKGMVASQEKAENKKAEGSIASREDPPGAYKGSCANVEGSPLKSKEGKPFKNACIDTSNNVQVIEIEDGEVPNSETSEMQIVDLFELEDRIWYYVDPSGNQRGPFDMISLRYWMEQGYFDEDFKVWRIGQTRENSMLLTDALHLCQY